LFFFCSPTPPPPGGGGVVKKKMKNVFTPEMNPGVEKNENCLKKQPWVGGGWGGGFFWEPTGGGRPNPETKKEKGVFVFIG